MFDITKKYIWYVMLYNFQVASAVAKYIQSAYSIDKIY